MSNDNTALGGGEPLNHGTAWPSTRAPSASTQQENQGIDRVDTDREKEMTTTPTPANEELSEGEYPTGFRMAMIVVALVLGVFLVSLDMTIVATAIPKITDEFGGLEEVSWYGSAFFLCVGGFQSTWGKAFKYFPLKLSFLLSIVIFEIGSLLCGVAPNSVALIVGRSIAGVGAAGIGTGAYTIIAFAVPPKKRPLYTGIVGASYGIASVVGPVLGGVFSDKATWRWCFYINLPIGGIAALAIVLFFHTPPAAKPQDAPLKEKILQMDPVGTMLVMAAVVSYILALQYGGQTKPWNSSVVIGLLIGFVLISITFGVWEYFQGERAMIIPRLMSDRTVSVSALYAFFFAGADYVVIYYLPLYFQSIDGVSPTESGVRNLPLIIAVTIATICSGGSITTNGIATPLAVAGAVIATIGSGLLYTLDIGTSTGKWIGYQILAGVGYGLGFQVPIIYAQGNAAAEDLSSVTAIVLFFQTLGGAILVAAAQSAFVNEMVKTLIVKAPSVNPLLVITTGATQIRSIFSPEQLPGVLTAYMQGIKVTLGIATGATGMAVLISLLSSWRRLNPEALKGVGGAA